MIEKKILDIYRYTHTHILNVILFPPLRRTTGGTGASRRLAKLWLEQDRLLWARAAGYACELCCMSPAGTSPKHHILFGWPAASPPPPGIVQRLTRTLGIAGGEPNGCDCGAMLARGAALLAACPPCEAGANTPTTATTNHRPPSRFGGEGGSTASGGASAALVASAQGHALAAGEFSETELAAARRVVEQAATAEGAAVPTGSSARQRRLVHWTAEAMGLEHWSDRSAGKKPKAVWVRARDG